MATRRKTAEDKNLVKQEVFSKWFDIAADWADAHAKHLTFTRDEYDGWFATIHFSDASGAYSATVDQVRKKPKEAASTYYDRVRDSLRSAVEEAYRKRALRLAKRPMNIPQAAEIC